MRLGLIVKEPYASMIVKGLKVWEIRKRRTNIRGEIYIISRGFVIGKVSIVDVLGPFTVEELLKYEEKHRVDYNFLKEYAGNSKLYAWVLKGAKKFDRPLKVKVPKGAQIWVRLNDLNL
ncbi:ASCH domain-containing protein [Archaeoglobus sp.]